MLVFCFSSLKTANIEYLEIFAFVQFLQLSTAMYLKILSQRQTGHL